MNRCKKKAMMGKVLLLCKGGPDQKFENSVTIVRVRMIKKKIMK